MNDRTLVITQDNGTIFVTPLAPLSPPPVAPFSFAPVEPEFPPSNNSSNNTAITTPLPDSSQTGSDFSVYLPAVLVPAGVVVIGVIIFAVLYTKYKAKQHARRMGILNPMQCKQAMMIFRFFILYTVIHYFYFSTSTQRHKIDGTVPITLR